MSLSLAGRFVWRELVTPNPTLAAEFYAGLFGWTSNSTPMPGMEYSMFRNTTLAVDVGGMMKPMMEGAPAHWGVYLTVDDLDAAVAAITAHGGTIVMPPMHVPGVGRWAVAVDPQGAVFCPFVGDQPGATPDARPPVGTFCWSQLMTRNLDAAVPFYNAVTGWTGEMNGPMVFFKSGGVERATAMALPAGLPMPPHWMSYVAVEDCDATAARAVELGAQLASPPATIPGMGRFAVLIDPTGAVFALWKNLMGAE